MRVFRWGLTLVLLVILGMALFQTLHWFGMDGTFRRSQVRPLETGDEEIALIEPSTSTEEWGRLATALQLIEKDWPRVNPDLPALHVSLDDAFPRLTTDVPEIVLELKHDAKQRLRLRWYKISGEHDAASWIAELRRRQRAPLAVIGGGTSDRAVRLGEALKKVYPFPGPEAPLLLMTTATAEKTRDGELLIDVYPGRTFRFSFTNQRIVESLLQFAQHRGFGKDQDWARNLWVSKPVDPHLLTNAVASMVGRGDFWHLWATLRSFPQLQPYTMYAFSWQDERYSQDMTDLFEQAFKIDYPLGEFYENTISYSVGGFYQPAPQEQVAVGTFLARPAPVTPSSFLVLPTQTVRMRRFLINLRQRSAADARNLVILNGDAISFHSVYRDREVIWNILDLPYSLVFFSHRNPVDHKAGFTWLKEERRDVTSTIPPYTTSGTQDLLLYRDIFESLLYAAFDKGELVHGPTRIEERLRATRWRQPPPGPQPVDGPRVCNRFVHGSSESDRALFDAAGNRQSHTGEHIVWVKPNFFEDRVDLTSKISVWTTHTQRDPGTWRLVEAFDATYNQSRQEEIAP